MIVNAARRPAPPKLALLSLACASLLLWAGQAQAFSLDEVTAQARTLMNKPYVAPVNNLPPAFSGMQFADYQKLQPRADRFEWKDLDTPFRLNFYHQGMQFNSAVRINEITADGVQEIKYDPDRFDFGGPSAEQFMVTKKIIWYKADGAKFHGTGVRAGFVFSTSNPPTQKSR